MRAYAVVAQILTDGTLEVLGVEVQPWADDEGLADPDAEGEGGD